MTYEQVTKRGRELGLTITDEGLIVPRAAHDVLDKIIAPDLVAASERIRLAHTRGKEIIFLPGSYDLVHLGHLSYIDQAVDYYLHEAAAHGRMVTRSDLYIVVMADDDELIAYMKRSKHIDHGGNETFMRPVDRGLDANGRSPRLDSLASLPVDLVGWLPSPLAANIALPTPPVLDLDACRAYVAAASLQPKSRASLDAAIDGYAGLSQDISAGVSLRMEPGWSVVPWQLYLMTILFTGLVRPLPHGASPRVTRILSIHDGVYLHEAQTVSELAGLATLVIDDAHIISTTALLERYGADYLRRSKRA